MRQITAVRLAQLLVAHPSDDLSDVAKAAVADQVATLLLEADRVIPGVLDRTNGADS